MPKHEINPDHLRNIFSHLKDVDFHLSDADVSILIGADIPELHTYYDVRQGSKNQPTKLLTLLGWVLMGGIDSKATQINSNRISVNNKNLENSIENFWKIDFYGTPKDSITSLLSRNEIKALGILEKTVTKIDGHYSLGLLWRDKFPNLPNNRSLALSRFLSLEKKFENNPEFHKQHQKTIKEYIEKGYATIIKDENNTNIVINYLPHHGVVNINKPGKVRVVFDAGATYNSTSLNKSLLKSPDLLNNLVRVLTRFRMGRYVVMGDIEQMFHQILVENKDILRFLWRDNYIDPIEDYRMKVHLFGNVDSPCIANWTIKKTAADQSDFFDQISIKTIESDFYMDNFLSSFHEISVAVKVCVDVENILQKGGFRLTKFISNNPLLQALPSSNISP